MTNLPVSSSPRRRGLSLDALVCTAGLGLFAACPGEGPADTTATVGPPESTSTSQGDPEPTGPTGTASTTGTEESTAPLGPDSEASSTSGSSTDETTSGETTSGSTTDETTSGSTSGTTTSGSTTDETGTTDETVGTTGQPIDCAPDLAVLQGSYSIENQLDVAALAAFKEITGDLTIHAPGLGSLAGLECLQRVGGDLDIRETALTSLDGLDSLAEVGGQLLIEFNAQLADLQALGNLVSVGASPQEFGDFKLKGSPSLKSLAGLGALSFVGHSVYISSNGIETLAGLGAATIHGELRFEYNADLVDVLDVAEFLPTGTIYFLHNKKLWCGNAEMALTLMKANGFLGGMFLDDNLNGCGDL
ncbi:hypothetical protein [Nannocystis pusilla]|uniref:hypothetical protein n=1 Tax=Nannocystis pusilla TaxID=889268 RepID=UPI003BEFBD48